MRDACEKYHDHVAGIYDDMYQRSPYWDFYHEISWNHMKNCLPSDLSAEAHDAGCGTGLFGLKLLKAGFRVLFSDISSKMLDVARRKADEAGYSDRAEFIKMDISDMRTIPDSRFGFVCAQGDPLSLCRSPERAMAAIARTLAPGGTAVLSVDNRTAGYEHFLEKNDLDGLADFHKRGVWTWLAKQEDERFPCRTFTPERLRKLAADAGLDTLSMIGKTVLPLRKHPKLLEDRRACKVLKRIEAKLAARESNLGRASHIQVALKKLNPA